MNQGEEEPGPPRSTVPVMSMLFINLFGCVLHSLKLTYKCIKMCVCIYIYIYIYKVVYQVKILLFLLWPQILYIKIILISCVFVFTEKQEKEVDVYASLSDEKAFVFSVALAEINRKILSQRLIL
uniref:Uncharacterized protein n=1 Tax=Poecilia latipinna TaxID=48699 RepID=A0A3B3VZ12_9TELE